MVRKSQVDANHTRAKKNLIMRVEVSDEHCDMTSYALQCSSLQCARLEISVQAMLNVPCEWNSGEERVASSPRRQVNSDTHKQIISLLSLSHTAFLSPIICPLKDVHYSSHSGRKRKLLPTCNHQTCLLVQLFTRLWRGTQAMKGHPERKETVPSCNNYSWREQNCNWHFLKLYYVCWVFYIHFLS